MNRGMNRLLEMKIITNEILYTELMEQRKLLQEIMKREIRTSIEELSLSQTASLLHVDRDKILEYVRLNQLKGRRVPSKKSKNGFTYKFRAGDVYEFQKRAIHDAELEYCINPEATDLTIWFKSLREQFHTKTPQRRKKK